MNQIYKHKKTGIRYGVSNGFPFVVKSDDVKHFRVCFAVDNPNGFDIESEIFHVEDKAFKKSLTGTYERTEHGFELGLKAKAIAKDAKLEAVLDVVTGIMRAQGFVPVCSVSGAEGNLQFYRVGMSIVSATHESFDTLTRGMEDEVPKTNIAMGILGAFGGMALGSVAWILIAMMGYISGWIGILVVFLGYAGFEKFGGRVNKTMAVVIFLISLVFIPIAHFIATGIQVYREVGVVYGWSMMESFKLLGEVMANDTEVMAGFIGEVVFGLIFAIIGGIAQMVRIMKTTDLVDTSEVLNQY